MAGFKKWSDRFAGKIYRCIPKQYRREWIFYIKKLYQGQYVAKEEVINRKAKLFILTQIKIVISGLFLCVFFGVCLAGFHVFTKEQPIQITRNSFGQGSSQTVIDIQKEEESTSFTLEVAEQQMTKEELENLYEEFFISLGEVIRGENVSLQKVNQSLNLTERLDGFPFYAQYSIEDANRIQYNGTLGTEAASLEEGFIDTKITVNASYEDTEREKTYLIRIVPTEAKKEVTSFDSVIAYIKEKEKESRNEEYIMLSGKEAGAFLRKSGETNRLFVLWMLFPVTTAALFFHSLSKLKEQRKKSVEGVLHDFPIIVHFITLYMGAGLSFAKTVAKISEDYKKGLLTDEERYAFEQIVQMDNQMEMGVSQTEACEIWAEQMSLDCYQKLAVMLTQGMTKGSRELKLFLHQIEQEAFREHVNRTRKRGEEASTILLLPMAVLLLIVMLLVMFPAMVQFQNFS